MKKYLISLLLIFLLFVFLSIGCTLVRKPTVKEIAEEKAEVVKEVEAEKFELALDFKLQDLNQNTFTLSSYKDKQPVILFFWTTWCPFCRTEMRQLKDLYPQLKKEGWELMAIDVGEHAYRVQNFLKSRPVDFKVLLDKDREVAYSYDILGIPTYILVDKKGQIVFRDHSFPQEYKKLIPQ